LRTDNVCGRARRPIPRSVAERGAWPIARSALRGTRSRKVGLPNWRKMHRGVDVARASLEANSRRGAGNPRRGAGVSLARGQTNSVVRRARASEQQFSSFLFFGSARSDRWSNVEAVGSFEERSEEVNVGSSYRSDRGRYPPCLFLWTSARFRETSGRWPLSMIDRSK
jgi:hypothetical protein